MDNNYVAGTNCKCLRCNHEWTVRKPEKPRLCPNCGSAYWDLPKRNGRKEVVQKVAVEIPILRAVPKPNKR